MELLIRLIADGLVIVVVLISGMAFVIHFKKDYKSYAKAVAAGLTAFTIARIMSLFYQTPERPFVTLGIEPGAAYLDNPGFPSDHALFVMTITLIVWIATRNTKVGIVLLLLALLTGWGRVAAYVHTPIDVFGGYAAAIVGVGIWYGMTLIKRRRGKA